MKSTIFHANPKWFRYLITLLILLSVTFAGLQINKEDMYAASKQGTVNTEGLNVRSKASTKGNIIVSLPKGTTVTITKTKTNKKNEKWHKIKVTLNNTSYQGFVLSSYINVATSTPTNPTYQGFVCRFGNLNTRTPLYLTRSKRGGIRLYLKKKTLVRVTGKQKIGLTTWCTVKTYGLKTNYKGYIPKKYITYQKTKTASSQYQVSIVQTKTGLYKTANGTDTRIGTIAKGQDVILLGNLTVGNKNWAKVKTSAGTGYLDAERLTPVTSTCDSTTNYTGVVTKRSYTRKVASLLATNMGTAEIGTNVTVEGRLTVNKVIWYKCSFPLNGSTVTGYIRASSVSLSTEAAFQEALQEFPDSYKTYLQNLHAAHPNWFFNAVKTGLDWNTVIANEATNGKNTIQSNYPSGGATDSYSAPFSYLSTAAGDYDWATDTYTLRDGSNWYAASDSVISYYMDPRNFLTDEGIFQFESLAYESTQTQDVVNTMLKDTFMKGTYSVNDIATNSIVTGSYSDAFMTAASAAGVSPYYLVLRVINEVGVTGSGSTSGTYPGYEGYYNFYNIGANDSATGQAIANGLSWAKGGATYNRPWTNPYKSIVGGASYIANQYISLGQNTMYTQKFNVVVPTSLYLHQYMTNVTAANSYATSNYKNYYKNGLLDDSFIFYIPVYENMPAATASLPASTGNPNSYLKNLTIKNTSTNKKISLNQTFTYNTTEYTAAVGSNVTSINISADAISSHAKVGNTGTYTLNTGTNQFTIACTAGDGTVTNYTITIVRH